MFELNIAAKYLLPHWKRLSLSLISMIAILVISLVVWLILVFFSVTNGLEKMWIDKLIVLTGPARIYPTDEFYKSYYYLIDTISHSSDYQAKSIEEKLESDQIDPWDEMTDEEIPANWPVPLLKKDGTQVDILKELKQSIDEIPGLGYFIYEVAPSNVKITLERRVAQEESKKLYMPVEGQIQQNGLVLSFDQTNKPFEKNLLPLRPIDIDNLFKVSTSNPNLLRELEQTIPPTLLETPSYGWILPKHLYPKDKKVIGYPQYLGDQLRAYLIPPIATSDNNGVVIDFSDKKTPLLIEGGLPIQVNKFEGMHPEISFSLQDVAFKGPVSLNDLNIIKVQVADSPPWIHLQDGLYTLPYHKVLGEAILLPKTFQDSGALVGDRGFLIYEAPSLASTSQVQLPVYVAGFYDPGIMAMGGKFILAAPDVASLIRSSISAEPFPESNGIQLKYSDPNNIHQVKKRLQKSLLEKGIAPYFTIETFEDYDFAKGFIQELKSQKNVFLILAGMIILVACSNIISMLIILVNDKKKEIGILRALGARTVSIGTIFGLIGLSMGVIGSLIGIGISLITLHYLPALISLLSRLQGFDAFQRLFYNNTFPSQLSIEALQFVLFATTLTSLLAAIIPAIKACSVKPAAMLRSE